MADDADLVRTEVDADGVATFTLNRPERRNAWTAAMENRYFDVLAAADTDPAVRVGVLTGAGTSFCPGMDMGRLAEVAGRPMDISARRPQYAPRLFRKPLIAAINGACAGIGLTQALMCDVRFAARGARFSTAFARRGLGAEYGMSWVLPRYVGVGNALDLLLSSRVFEADEARDLGLVNRVLEPADVLPAASGVRPRPGPSLLPGRHGRDPASGARRPRCLLRGRLPPLIRGDGSPEQRPGLPGGRGQLRGEAAPGVPAAR